VPLHPVPTTADLAETDELTWSVPVDANGQALDFTVEIYEEVYPGTFMIVSAEDSDADASSFSGTPPYTEGTGTVTYSVPATLASGTEYRWRVQAMKDADTGVTGNRSTLQRFIMA